MTLVAGVDIGGTKIAAGLVTGSGELLRSRTTPTPAAEGSEAVLAAAASAVAMLDEPVGAVGVGSAGVIDPRTGTVRSATAALPGWAGTDLRGELSRRLGVPVSVVNDVHAHALGEEWQGAAAGFGCVLFVAAGTGIGASLVVDGSVHHGANAAAGHAGHMSVASAAGYGCPCGASGHVEAVAGGPALLGAYRQRSGVTTPLDLRQVARRAEQGEAVASNVLATGGRALGELLGGLVNTLDPDIVLVGGGVSSCGDSWWRSLRSACEAEALPAVRSTPLLPGALGSDAALLGAARLGWEALR